MWSTEKPRQDKIGKRWNFSYWYAGVLAPRHSRAQRVFFWDDHHKE